MTSSVESLGHGIYCVDTGFHRPQFDAAYLVVETGRAAFIDCGTSHSVANLLAALETLGLAPEQVDWLILTHVHLDHAGGAGALLRQLPKARVVVHPRGAPHMIDPARLIAGATAVYGEAEMARSYGTIVPVPEERVQLAREGHIVDLAGRELHCLDTPGHAMHHICIHDPRSRSIFAGDTFGIAYRELSAAGVPFVFPTTTPVQFDPEALKASLQRLLALEPEFIQVAHFGRIGDPGVHARTLGRLIDAMVEGTLANATARDRHGALTSMLDALYTPAAVAHGGLSEAAVRDLIGMDIELNAQGLGVWLDRRQRRAAAESQN